MIDDGSFCHESDLAAVPPSRFSPKGSSTD
jgi:hypothetical protein